MTEFLIGFIGILSLLGIPYLAKKRGRNPFLFFFLTLFIGPLAVIFLLKRKENSNKSKTLDPAYPVDNLKIDVVATVDEVFNIIKDPPVVEFVVIGPVIVPPANCK